MTVELWILTGIVLTGGAAVMYGGIRLQRDGQPAWAHRIGAFEIAAMTALILMMLVLIAGVIARELAQG